MYDIYIYIIVIRRKSVVSHLALGRGRWGRRGRWQFSDLTDLTLRSPIRGEDLFDALENFQEGRAILLGDKDWEGERSYVYVYLYIYIYVCIDMYI